MLVVRHLRPHTEAWLAPQNFGSQRVGFVGTSKLCQTGRFLCQLPGRLVAPEFSMCREGLFVTSQSVQAGGKGAPIKMQIGIELDGPVENFNALFSTAADG